ncbi:hypothetical protein A6A08_19085 [Nocardiopsis sp. TSRI0078]|uniref:hypothetical protein n=1 Tax=unclassified Nocardiopsis TaxID=2649073 RepID=UPI000939F4D0|nr:hypothetical protein [Nocardiopsis sp. TSRI0078]OKI22380.1 hypothetical protein A6A08_19085 [Nocardiopsis sp. TSRI0078]
MERDAARERAGTVAGAREETCVRDDRPVHTLRARSSAPLVATVAVTAVVSALAAAEVTGSLVGRPLSGGALTRFHAHGSGAPGRPPRRCSRPRCWRPSG